MRNCPKPAPIMIMFLSNWMSVGSQRVGKTMAIAFTLIETAELNGVDPKPGSPTC